jgi:hypothetical protein
LSEEQDCGSGYTLINQQLAQSGYRLKQSYDELKDRLKNTRSEKMYKYYDEVENTGTGTN